MRQKVKIIAEIGVNHNGKISYAKKLIKIASDAGADYVKFQIFKTSEHVTKRAVLAKYQINNINKKTNQYEMIRKLEFNKKEFKSLFNYCKKLNIKFLASCFDICSLNIYSQLGASIFKIPSGEITNLPLLELIGSKKKKVILSTGMSTYGEIKRALDILVKKGTSKKNITILQCTTDYPCEAKDVNLLVIPQMIKTFKCKVGFSDHTLGYEAAIAATSFGASIIEKHITINKNFKGPDHKASLNFKELKEFINKIRNLELAFGTNKKNPSDNEKRNLKVVRKSLVAKKKILPGDNFSNENIDVKRPGDGISPMKIRNIFGKKAKKKFNIDDKIST